MVGPQWRNTSKAGGYQDFGSLYLRRPAHVPLSWCRNGESGSHADFGFNVPRRRHELPGSLWRRAATNHERRGDGLNLCPAVAADSEGL